MHILIYMFSIYKYTPDHPKTFDGIPLTDKNLASFELHNIKVIESDEEWKRLLAQELSKYPRFPTFYQ